MKITICGSMAFAKEMLEIQRALEKKGHTVFMPDETEAYAHDVELSLSAVSGIPEVGAERKISRDLIRKHYDKIGNSDAILVLNYDRRGIKGYIGGNSFLEMGFAHILQKPIYLFNDMPHEMHFILEEVKAMRPLVLNGDLLRLV